MRWFHDLQRIPTEFSAYLQPDLSDNVGSFTVTDVQPHILSAKSATNAANSPTYTQAINSPHAEKWWDAMESKLTTLESDLQAWELVPREPWMHVLPAHGPFASTVSITVWLRSLKLVSVYVVTGKWRVLTSLKPGIRLSNGPLSDP